MDKKIVLEITLTLLLTSMLTLAFSIQPLEAEPTTIVSVDPPTTTALIGETFNVNVTVADVSNLFAWQLLMWFDPNVLQVDNVTEGPFLALTGEETDFIGPTINNEVGYIIVGCLFMPPLPEYGASGDGVLATIAFLVKGVGATSLSFDKDETLTFLKEVIWTDYNATIPHGFTAQIPCTLVDGYFDNRAFIAVVDVSPNALNLRGKGKWVTVYIELLKDYVVEDIDISTILLNDEVPTEDSKVCGRKLNVRFNRSEVIALLSQVGEVELIVTGKLFDGTSFEARDTIRVR